VRELFKRAGKEIWVNEARLHDPCSVLYDKTVRNSIDQLRDADKQKLEALAEDLSKKRLNGMQSAAIARRPLAKKNGQFNRKRNFWDSVPKSAVVGFRNSQ